jgi:acetylserotonin N-methyltransferase
MLLDEGGTSPPEVLLQSLNMLTQTHGRERKASEYCHLLETVGFTDIASRRTGTYLDVVLAYKRQECTL